MPILLPAVMLMDFVQVQDVHAKMNEFGSACVCVRRKRGDRSIL